MSDELRKRADYVIHKISQLVDENSTSKVVQDILIDLLEDQEETLKRIVEIEKEIYEIKEELKGSDFHKMR